MKGNLVFNAMFDKFKFDGHFIVRNLDRPHFCLLECRILFFAIFFKYLRKFLDFFFNTEYKIVASMLARFLFYAIQLSYSSSFTFAFVRTASTMPSFLLLLQKNWCNDSFLLVRLWQQLPWKTASCHCSMQRLLFFMHRQAVYKWKLQVKKRKTIIKKIKFIPVSALFSARLIPSTLSTNQQNWIHSPRGHYFATIPLTRGQNDPGLEIAWCFERIFEDSERFSFR